MNAKGCYSGVSATYCVGCKTASDPSYDPSVDCLYIWALTGNTYQPVRYYRSECLKVYDEADCNSIEKLQCLNDLPEPDIDIKFCSNPNAFNCKKKGVVPVTIFGSDTFDVSNIDLSTVMLCLASDADCSNGLQALHAQSPIDRGDPTTDLGTDTCTDGIATLDTFAEIDVVFDAREVAELIGCDGLNRNDSSETLVIKGMLLDGTEFESIPQDDIGIDQLVIMNK